MRDRDVQKYLKKCRLLPVEPRLLDPAFPVAAVIPACDELDDIGGTLATLLPEPDEAVLIVVNHPEDASERVRQSSAELLRLLRSGALACPNLHWIDAPDLTGGVGEARKLGMDAVIASRNPEELEQTLIASLDADTTVEADYFAAIRKQFESDSSLAALSIPFRHRAGATAEEEAAIRHYETYLQRYVDRLHKAGSPYAFHTVGSAFAVRGSDYVRCGGMRVRKGGEDFYFLQAVAKIGNVASGDRVLLYPSPRPSARVPFGTGPSVRKLMEGQPPDEISDNAFAHLKQLLENATPERLANAELLLNALDPKTAEFLRAEHFTELWPKVLKNTPPHPGFRQKAFHDWFDGLKTLRLLHHIDRNET